MSLSEKARWRRRGEIPFSWFPIEWLSPSWERGKERESCNCCQSLLSTALKAAAVSQLRSERSLGCVASPLGLWRIWWVLSPPFLFTSHCQQRHTVIRCRGIRGLRAYHARKQRHGVIEKIILNMPAMIWKVFKWWKFPFRNIAHKYQNTKGFPNNINAQSLTCLCLLQMPCQPLWQICIHPSSSTFP